MSGPLKGIKVLDAGAFTVGPAACSLLGLLGAQAIRIEPPTLDGLAYVGTIAGGTGTSYISSHYNKKNIILDLRSPWERRLAPSWSSGPTCWSTTGVWGPWTA